MVLIAYIMVLVFVGLSGYILYYTIHDSEVIISNPANRRQDNLAEFVVRGDIVTADDVVVATTEIDEDGDESRAYPYGELFCHAIGYNSYGRAGVELEQNFNLLRSHVNIVDKVKNELDGVKNPGDRVVTNLRFDLQETAMDSLHGARGAVVVIEPSTGKILTMVSSPSFNPEDIDSVWEHVHSEDVDPEEALLLNRVTQGLYTPGSTFKILTAIEYMREHPGYDDYSYYCEGSGAFNGLAIRCAGGNSHGDESLEQSFANSCNTSFANLGLDIDMGKLRLLSEELLFNQKLPYNGATSKSRFVLDKSSDEIEIPQTVIGQGDTMISPLHNALIMSAIVNGGVLMRPYIVDRVENVDGVEVKSYSPKTYDKILPAEDIRRILPLLRSVCEYGTASGYMSGVPYYCGGKTGTAEVDDNGRMNSWFVGYCGSDEDEADIVISVVVEDYSSNNISAASVARAVFDEFYD